MMKGVSPVVATVLLIAIAVVAAVAVWFWVGAMGRPAVPAQEVRAFIVENCVLSTNQLRLYNNGALTIAANIATVRDSSLGNTGAIVNITSSMSPGTRQSVSVVNATNTSQSVGLTAGNTYYLEYPNIPLVKFGC